MGKPDKVEPPTAPPAPVLTAEEWATRKGMLPEIIEAPAPFARPGAPRPLVANPDHWKFAAARVAWPQGKELTEAEFDAAVHVATNHVYR